MILSRFLLEIRWSTRNSTILDPGDPEASTDKAPKCQVILQREPLDVTFESKRTQVKPWSTLKWMLHHTIGPNRNLRFYLLRSHVSTWQTSWGTAKSAKLACKLIHSGISCPWLSTIRRIACKVQKCAGHFLPAYWGVGCGKQNKELTKGELIET